MKMDYDELVQLNDSYNHLEGSMNALYHDGKIIVDGILVADLEFQHGIYIWYVPFLFVILGLACAGNSIIAASSFFLQKPISIYLKLCVSLAVSDLWAAILISIGLYVNSYLPSVKGQVLSSLCFNMGLEIIRISGMFTSVLHLLALASGQFIGIVWPIQYKWILSSKRINSAIAFMYVFPLIIISLIFYIFMEDEPPARACAYKSYAQLPFRALIFGLFIIPLIGTFILYTAILYLLLKKRDTVLNRSRGGTNGSVTDENKIDNKLKLVKTTMTILSTFTFSWGICVLYFFLVCKRGCAVIYLVSIDFYTAFICNSFVNTMVALKLVINPLIYAFRINKIRDAIVRMVRVICCNAELPCECLRIQERNSHAHISLKTLQSRRGEILRQQTIILRRRERRISTDENKVIEETNVDDNINTTVILSPTSDGTEKNEKIDKDGSEFEKITIHAEINDNFVVFKNKDNNIKESYTSLNEKLSMVKEEAEDDDIVVETTYKSEKADDDADDNKLETLSL
uniref:G_PROTEIN_RECEP_F1_2 domain-containing protein n=1 Tax=Parastrongyloides trichosuri TaxID=131310 RepID=A0A0N5A3W3_PARTI